MKRSLKDLTGYNISIRNQPNAAKVKDILFDEERWVVRYVEADFGNMFESERILLPWFLLEAPDWEIKNFPLKITREDIERCPKPEDKKPVSREFEEKLHKHIGMENYWRFAGLSADPTMLYPVRPLHIPQQAIEDEEVESKLRSFKEVKGYNVVAIDKGLGYIDDLIVDDEDWQIIYFVIDTSKWLPWSKKVLIAINWLKDISYINKEVKVDLHTETIKNTPEFDPSVPITLEYEKDLHEYYGK